MEYDHVYSPEDTPFPRSNGSEIVRLLRMAGFGFSIEFPASTFAAAISDIAAFDDSKIVPQRLQIFFLLFQIRIELFFVKMKFKFEIFTAYKFSKYPENLYCTQIHFVLTYQSTFDRYCSAILSPFERFRCLPFCSS